jgi:hypothetical protein
MPKMNPEVREGLARAHDEIVSLRGLLANAAPKAHAYDTIAMLARQAVREERQGMGTDVLWTIAKLIDADDQADAQP